MRKLINQTLPTLCFCRFAPPGFKPSSLQVGTTIGYKSKRNLLWDIKAFYKQQTTYKQLYGGNQAVDPCS
ncbi:MAG TPA: hypothetical protein VFA15_01690, partial [Nitrososphaera sp.]|nr:hypothetical protein [Nitrososphaera sp.]